MSAKISSRLVWRLRRGMDRRFRSGHPWVYSNELMESPKGIEPGALIELQDSQGRFLAKGFGNPKSLISFRALTRNSQLEDPVSIAAVVSVLVRAMKVRASAGLAEFSYRLCFGEVDGLPGLVIDRYVTENRGQVFVVQAHTAGADHLTKNILEILECFVQETQPSGAWAQSAVVLRNDISVRKLEGLEESDAVILREPPDAKLSRVALKDTGILVASVLGGKPLVFHVDLVEGQKTGFFLDQFANIQLAALRFKNSARKNVRILDLCCYVGQWGAQLTRVFRDLGLQVEVVAVDASQTALAFARKNIEAEGAVCKTIKADVLRDLAQFPSQSFDIVISDPPALIKSRKDLPTGRHAYLQLATQAFRLVKVGGGIVCCSCSALLEEEIFSEVLAKAAHRNRALVQWVGRGSQSPDHPMIMEFPEGRYLKGWMGVVSEAGTSDVSEIQGDKHVERR